MKKLTKLTKLWEGLTAVFAALLCVLLVATGICNNYASSINGYLGIVTSEFVNDEVDPDADLEYYKSSFGDLKNEANLKKLVEFLQKQNEDEMREGAALLYNEGNALPLGQNKKVSTFGVGAKFPSRADGGASTSATEANSISLKDALAKEKIEINPTIWDAYGTASSGGRAKDNSAYTVTTAGNAEKDRAFYEARMNEVGEYTDAAIVVIGRKGSEGSDAPMDMTDTVGGDTQSALALFRNELDMLTTIKNSGKFDKVVVCLNTGGYAIETYEIEEMFADSDIKLSILMIGNPGRFGLTGVAEIISGTTNPSGKLVDTYAKNSLSAPAVVNSGTRTPYFSNATEGATSNGDTFGGTIDKYEQVARVSIQVENIYIGYRYYETRYADVVSGDGNKNASNAAGASFGATAWEYKNEISYPFGYGLSYTTFEENIESINTNGDNVVLKINVKNTGAVAGKHAVQVYAQTPYGEYEKTNKVEKAGIQLVGYGKTKLLQPKDDETVTVTIDKYLLASYDYTELKGYYLSSGDYYFATGEDAHDALNNVLALRGFKTTDGMVASTQNAVDASRAGGNAALAKKWTIGSRDEDSYRVGRDYNGERTAEVTNLFDDCDVNNWVPNTVKYLSRSDWAGTYPVEQTTVEATKAMLDRMAVVNEDNTLYYTTPEGAPTFEEVAANFGNDKGITIASMREIPITETEAWRQFIFQMKVEDVHKAITEGWSGIAAIGDYIPTAPVGDGTNGGSGAKELTVGSTTFTAVQYCSKNILTGTFNDELYAGRGRAMGEEARLAGDVYSWNIGVDLHRTPFGGRNSEYMSECPTISYLAAIPEVEAMQKCGTMAGAKHFVGNDQETFRDGVAVFFTEQAFREGSLRGGEGALRVANSGAIMQSFERLGVDFCSHKWAMNTGVLRNEWNWQGYAITDACPIERGPVWAHGYRAHTIEMIASGTSGICFDFNEAQPHGANVFAWAKEHNDGYLLECLINSAIQHAYAVSRTVPTNGISGSGHMVHHTPWWKSALLAGNIVFGILAAAGAALVVFSKLKEDK